MPQVLWASDIHLDSCSEEQILTFINSIPRGSSLIITGDISNASRIGVEPHRFSHKLADSQIYFVLGNHDFYGSYINPVRYYIKDFVNKRNNIQYLPEADPVNIQIGNKAWALIGIDGWADAKAGNFEAAPSLLKDYQAIYDFANMDTGTKRRFLNTLGQEEAYKLKAKLDQPLESDNILIATHVPPYAEAHVYNGKPASSMYLPHFVCVQVGEVISAYAAKNPNKNIHVICGHTHNECHLRISDNVMVHVSGAGYGNPTYTDLAPIINT